MGKSKQRELRSCLRRVGFISALAAICISHPVKASEPSGEWLVADQSARIKIELCDDKYWGAIDWERQPGIDSKNPDPARRGQPLLGVPILVGMKATQKPNEWEGQVYNPKDGGYYFARLSMIKPDVLRLEGCVLGGLICSGETWTRVNSTTTGSMPDRSHRICPPSSDFGASPNQQMKN